MDKENLIYAFPDLFLNLQSFSMFEGTTYRDFHFHKAIELVRVEKGLIKCSFENETFYLSKNEVMFINSGVLHKLSNQGYAKISYIQIEMDSYLRKLEKSDISYFETFINSNHAKPYCVFSSKSDLLELFINIEKEAEEKEYCYNEYLKAYIFTLAAFMRRHDLLSDINSFCDRKRIENLLPAIEFIDEHFNMRISLDEVARTINCDKYRLCRLFKSATGSTVFDYLNFVRLYKAEQLLIKTQKSIGEIAFDCGFSSIQYFNRAFKERFGSSPGTYKKYFLKYII